MDSKSVSYGICRCCSVKGNHKSLMKEYYENGTRIVYIDIFMECFNLYLSTNQEISTLICDSCIQRLKEAHIFRNMVINSEHKLLTNVNENDTIFINVPAREMKIVDIKKEVLNEVKEESTNELVDCDSDYTPCENNEEELTRDIHDNDRIDGEAELLARFSSNFKLPTRNSLYTICQGYVTQLDLLKDKYIVPKTISKLLEEDTISHKQNNWLSEKMAQIQNASVILENASLVPFKSKNRLGFPCFYCRKIFEGLDKLREHQEKNHKRQEIRSILGTYGAECLVVYVDTTDLKCLICEKFLPNLNELKSHLVKIHKKKFYSELTDRIIPFKLTQTNIYECQVCGFNFETFGSIERHMNIHYRNYVCNLCGTGFITKYRLKVHNKSMHTGGNYPCEICKKVYTTHQKHKNHVDTVHRMIKRFKCPKCSERFSEYFRRQKHLVEVHGLAPLKYRCNVCDKTFDRRYTLSRHMKRDHLDERDFECQICSYKCFTKNELRVHMVKHNGERIFECSVCKKSYARKKTLREHMRIHNNDRRFACAVCGQAFVQKCSLKGHIKTHHIEYSLPPNF
ncbi:zinc finger protein 287-like isoform X2 [Aricia agestis]|uniref:zinc finger protein 287-like isoform X2 n=1 Tax=Aricia agestis TaxID=91739 RepID=UPI001C206A82|nr:zinc finger protein 287-like isoform X2 [Aricia agestis]